VLERILPAQVVVVESLTDRTDESLFPEEEAYIARAVAKRRREFTTVRSCARCALAALGYPPVPILPGTRRAPTWPAGVVGSLTHTDGYRAAAVARSSAMRALGIDAEQHAPLPEGVQDLVTTGPEPAALRMLAGEVPAVHWPRILFSAKEAVYKAWFPLTETWLGFEDAVITFDPGAGGFSAELLVPGPVGGFVGRFLVVDDLVLTAIALPPE
jgi:4'-phosphopantetheinyl transferase EntD